MIVYMVAFSPNIAWGSKDEPTCILDLSSETYSTNFHKALSRTKKNHQPADSYAVVAIDKYTAEVKDVWLASEFKEG
jgi:hypothetical protein